MLRNLRYFTKKVPVINVKLNKDAKKTEKTEPKKVKAESKGKTDPPPEKKKEIEGKKPEKVRPKQINVSILGANVDAGISTALFLKQHSLIKKLTIFGNDEVKTISQDLGMIDTNPIVCGFSKTTELNQALSPADIVVIIDTDWKNHAVEKKFHRTFHKMKFFAKKIRRHCPKALIINCVEPICCTTILLTILLRPSPLFKINRIIGSIAPLQCQVNNAAAEYLGMNPEYVYVPIIGGPSFGTFIPVLKLMTPDPLLTAVERLKFFRFILRRIDPYDMNRKKRSLLFEGVAISKLTLNVAKAMVGQDNIYASCFVRNRLLNVKSSFVTTVKFGREGVDKIYPVPKMDGYEMYEFMKSIANINQKERYIKAYCKRNGVCSRVINKKTQVFI